MYAAFEMPCRIKLQPHFFVRVSIEQHDLTVKLRRNLFGGCAPVSSGNGVS